MVYCIFLRGINVNGVKMRMKDLKEAFEDMGYTNVKTIGATGNVIVEADSLDKIHIEKALSDYFSYDASIVIRSKHQLMILIEQAKAIDFSDEEQVYSILSNDEGLGDDLINEYEKLIHEEDEALYVEGSNILWKIKKGYTLKSAFGKKVLGYKLYKDRLTSRNINTINKVIQYMEGM